MLKQVQHDKNTVTPNLFRGLLLIVDILKQVQDDESSYILRISKLIFKNLLTRKNPQGGRICYLCCPQISRIKIFSE